MKKSYLAIAMLLATALGPGPLAAPAARKAPKPAASTPTAATGTATRSTSASGNDFLADSTTIARVHGRPITVYNFRYSYYESNPLVRPASDSAGRVEFLGSMIDKEVLGLTALAVNPPLSLDDRIALRAHTKAVLQNVLFRRAVLDSVKITEERIQQLAPQFEYDQHLRSITFEDRATAEKVRSDLLRGRIPWSEAVRRYSYSKSGGDPQGDRGWVSRDKVSGEFAFRAFSLLPGGMSEVFKDTEGYALVRCVDRRRGRPVAKGFVRNQVMNDLNSTLQAPHVRKLYEDLRAFVGVVYDTANIRWAASEFRKASEKREPPPPGTIDLTDYTPIPDFSPSDTGRVLARTRDRTITLGQFLEGYSMVSALTRQDLSNLDRFIHTFDGPTFEPERLQLAYARGIDKDSLAVALIGEKKEEMLAQHLYQDSVANHVVVTPEMRRQYYRAHENTFVSIPRVRYARFLRPSLAKADSLMALLKAGERAERIMESDSLRGDDSTGIVLESGEKDPDEYHKLLFEELKPGEAAKVGPDKEGKYFVFQLLHYEPVRKMKYEEVQNIVDESVQNIEADRLLSEFLERHRRDYRIESHPEWVMRIKLRSPSIDRIAGEL